MLERLLIFSLSQRLFVLGAALVVVGLGVRAWLAIPIDAFPEISPTQVKIILKAPGMTAEEIERRVTQPIENELLGVPRQSILRSTTKYAITDITLDFEEGTDLYWARQQVAERLAVVRERLPANVSGGLAPMSTALSEMFMFTLENPNLDLLEKRDILDWEVRPLLRTVPGVADVNVLGGKVRSHVIVPDQALVAKLGITLEQIEKSVIRSLDPLGAGRINQGNDVLVVRSEAPVKNVDDITEITVSSTDGRSYRLGDIAEVIAGHVPRYGAVTRNGSEAAQALVVALRGSNTGEVAAGVSAKLKEIAPSLPPGSEINTFYDRSRLIATAVDTLSGALLQAVVLVVLVLALFLGNLRAAFIVSLSLPIAALITFLLMDQAGLTANLMSLGGLVIAIGMIVDSSVVVTENVLTRLSSGSGLPRLHNVLRASREVATPVVSGTLVIVIVFSPLLSLRGLEGKLFTPVALTIVFAMLGALLVSLTLVPALAATLLRPSKVHAPAYMLALQRVYAGSLVNVIQKPRYLFLSLVVLLIGSATILAIIGKTFMPVMDEGDIIVQLEKSPSITLQSSIDIDKLVEEALLESIPEIEQIVARTGSDELGLDPMSLNETDIFMELKPRSEWRSGGKVAIENAIRNVLAGFPGINVSFSQPIQMRTSEMLTGSTGEIAVKIFGQDLEILASLTEQVAGIIETIAGSVDVSAAVSEGGKYLAISARPEIATRLGLDTATLGDRLQVQLEGLMVAELIEGQRRTPIQIGAGRSNEGERPASLPSLATQPMLLPDGSSATLEDVAHINYREGPVLIEREQGNRFGLVSVNVENRDVVSVVEDIRTRLGKPGVIPEGYTLSYGGDFENQQRATNRLLLVVPFALGLILLLLFTTLGSLQRAALIIGNIPAALMGGLVALYISGEYLSVPASVGLIALLGVSVLNGVVMLTRLDSLQTGEHDLLQRVTEGAISRLRPVLMTAITAMLGLAPLVFATGPGAEIQRPLAIVVIGGLFTATLTTLYLLPVAYHRLEAKRER